MAFLPREFVVPELLETERFRIRPITIHDVVKDFDAVMSSREHLWDMFGNEWGWPPENLTIEKNLVDLGWHQKEFELRSSFDYAVMSLDESKLLGCVYIDPPTVSDFDVEVYLWVRQSELVNGLDEYLMQTVQTWVQTVWTPFKKVAYPGRLISWEEWNKQE